jgi:5-methylcytosine-specific restriction endonuclease McrA
MKKAVRQVIFDKYEGRCAYCGCQLEKGWHVDELLPCRRRQRIILGHWRGKEWIPTKTVPDGYDHPERLHIDNQMPACASCNINKHSMSLEDFRSLIAGFMKHLNEVNTQYKIAKRYGLVKEFIEPVVFYFETIHQ